MANETKNSSDVPTIEASVGNLSDLAVGIMKEVKVGDVGVLLSRTQKGVFAVGNKCTHYGAPLHTGVLSGDRVLCPWHKACFNVTTGDIEDAPALDALPSYKVRVSESGEIFVSAPQTEQCKASRRTPEMARPDQNPRHFVIVGGGAGGLVAAETLRNRGFTGKITLVSKEANLPIDRTKLSKDPANAHKSTLRDRAFFDRHSINLLLGQEATAISTAERTLTISDGSVLRWDNIFVSTGGSPRKLTVPGAHHKNVISVRDLSDVTHLNAEMAAGNVKQVVLVGGGFISLELAAYFTKNNVQATVVHSDALPLEKILGPQVAAIIKAQHVEKGVKFFPNARPTAIEGKDKAEAVVISSGERLPADFVIAGIGVTPNTAFLKTDPNIQLAADGSVIVDASMASRSGIFAGGDIVTFPNHYTGAPGRIEHWNVAQDQARVAARNMAGFHTEYKTVPFFWSMQFSGLRFLGSLAGGVDEVLFRPGHSNDLKTSFVAYYVKNNKVTAVCTMMADPTAVAASELMRIERFPSVEELKAALAQSAQTEQKNKDLDFAQLLRNAAH